MSENPELVEMTAVIVAAYVTNGSVPVADLPALMRQVHSALTEVASGGSVQTAPPAPLAPAVPIKKSISPDYLTCLEDGRKFKSLKRHLRAKFDLSPEAYRAKWGLPRDYPMVAPNYAAARSNLAKQMGLGQGGRKAVAAPAPAPAARAARGRPKKAT